MKLALTLNMFSGRLVCFQSIQEGNDARHIKHQDLIIIHLPPIELETPLFFCALCLKSPFCYKKVSNLYSMLASDHWSNLQHAFIFIIFRRMRILSMVLRLHPDQSTLLPQEKNGVETVRGKVVIFMARSNMLFWGICSNLKYHNVWGLYNYN